MMKYNHIVRAHFTNRIMHIVQNLPGKVFIGRQAVKNPANQEAVRAKIWMMVDKKFNA